MKKSLSILIIFLCLLTTLTNAQELSDKKNKSTEINGTNKIDGVTATGDKMTVKDEDGNILMEVTDEGEGGSVYLKPIPGLSSNYTSRLYNIGTQLYWNGFQLGTNESAGGWTDDGSVVSLSTNTDIVSLGINTPNTLYNLQSEVNTDIAGKAAIFGGASSSTPPTFEGYGIYGLRTSEGTGGAGVFGEAKGGGNGVYGKTDNEYGYGILGENINNGYAGYFLGKGYFSGNVGIGTSSPTAELHVTGDDGILFEGTFDSGAIPKEGSGVRMMWYPTKAAFRAGSVFNDEWDDINIGIYSTAMGSQTTASGYSSTAMGYNTKAESFYSTAIGYLNVGGGDPINVIGSDPLFEIGNGQSEVSRSNALTVLKNGNVGLGTANPERLLHLNGANPRILIEAASSNPEINFKNNGDLASDIWSLYKNGTTDDLQFYQNGNKVTIQKNTGNVGIGTTSPTYKLEVNGDAAKSSGGTAWIVSSDKRLKDIHGSYEKGLDEIISLEPKQFNYKKDNARNLPSDTQEIGFIAQEVQEVFPEAVNEGEDGYLDFNMHPINVAMVNAIKEQQKIIEELRNRITKLENVINSTRLTVKDN